MITLKKITILLIVLVSMGILWDTLQPTPAKAQGGNFPIVGTQPPGTYTVATLPTNLPSGSVVVVTDGNGYSCTSGSSTSLVWCRWSGSAWAPIGGAGSGVVTSLTGTANQIAVSAATGDITISIPTNPTLPGTTTGTFSGNLTGNVTGNASTATAIAANTGTTVTVLHGNAAGTPAFAVVTSADAAGNVSGTGNFCLVTNCTMVTPTLGAATGTSLVLSASLTSNALTATRVTFAGTSGILTDDSDMTFVTDTLTVTNEAVTTALTVAGAAITNNLVQNSKSADYVLVLSDAGKSIYHPGADTTARTWTIPANGSVAYPIGTAITLVNDTSGGVITVAITTDTLVLAGAGTTGSRSLAANGIATLVKMTATRWMIGGTGLT